MSKIRIFDDFFNLGETGLPFNVKFSFKAVFDYWEKKLNGPNKGEAARAKEILQQLEHATELKVPFTDIEILYKYEEEIGLLVSDMFPEQLTKNEIKAITLPFMPIYLNPTDRLDAILENAGPDFQPELRPLNMEQIYLNAAIFVLNYKYGANINFNRSLFMDIPDVRDHSTKHYRVLFNADFSDFKVNKNFKPLSQDDITELLDNFDNIELWKEKIPPFSFDFEGFSFIKLLDVSSEQIISTLKQDLLEKDALHSPEVVENIRKKLSSLYSIPDLTLGFAAYDTDECKLKSLGYNFWNTISMEEKEEQEGSAIFCDHAQNQLFKEKKTLAISDLDRVPTPKYNATTAKLFNAGYKSYIAAPLVYDNKTIGVLELASKQPRVLNSLIANNLEDIILLFTIALQRTMDEYETKIDSVVQENFTAIHPTVSWRFFDAAEKLQKHKQLNISEEIEEIVFSDVSPLYGQSDIKSSSTERNKAIQADLIEQLSLAKEVLDKAIAISPIPIYQELNYRIKKFIREMKNGLSAGHELTVLEFFQLEVFPVFAHLVSREDGMKIAVENFNSKLDPELGMVYNKRKDFEDSVSVINDNIADYIEAQQEVAQNMFPHYFEKYKTDGVEYNMYIGQSLVKNLEYDPIYLKNLRLWQLQTMVEVERMVKDLRPSLKVPLQICSLVLIHDTPLAIRFRNDEKQFDVDGAYNIRYEIVKKRIDKAHIKGTTDRLTIPDKIAIVYSQDKEAEEYLKYLEYLESIGYIEPGIERLELEDLPGATGLKALRVGVNYNIRTKTNIPTDDVVEALN